MLSLHPVLVTTSAVVLLGVAVNVCFCMSSIVRRSSAVIAPSSPITVASSSADGDIVGDTDGFNEGYGSFCETETFHATCALDEVIVMTKASYGRMRISRCVKLDYGHLGCVADVLEFADARCSGRRRCEIRIPDPEFARNKPCPEDLKPYMEAAYKCVKVQTARDFCIYPRPTPVSATTTSFISGFLASLVTELTGCGSVVTPWLIVARPGQTIRVTLHDYAVARLRSTGNHPRTQISVSSSFSLFSSSSVSAVSASSSSSQQCHAYAVLREPDSVGSSGGGGNLVAAGGGGGGGRSSGSRSRRGSPETGTGSRVSSTRNVTVCGGVTRQSVVYVTVGSRLEIGFERGSEQVSHGAYYVIEYQAIGCEDPSPTPNSVSLRNGDLLTVKCNFSREIYQRRCKDGQWIGEVANCSYGIPSNAVERLATSGLTMPYGLSVILVITIALVIGAFVLCAGLVVLNRRNGRHRRFNCCGESEELAFCSNDAAGTSSRSGEFIDIYGTTHRLVSGVSTDLVHQQFTGTSPSLQHQIVRGTVDGSSEKAQYMTAALVRHIGGSMAARAAAAINGHQLNDHWDLVAGITEENAQIEGVIGGTGKGNGVTSGMYGYGVVRPRDTMADGSGSTMMYGTAVSIDGDCSYRSSSAVSSRLTTRVYPPMANFSVGSGSSSVYGRQACSCCETYSPVGCAATVPKSESPASSYDDFRRAATIATSDGNRHRNRRYRATPTGSGNHIHDDDAGEFDVGDLSRRRRDAVVDSTNAASFSRREDMDDSSAEHHQRLAPETRDSPGIASTVSTFIKSSGCVMEHAVSHCSPSITDGDSNTEPLGVDGSFTTQPSSYNIVPELLSDCALHSSGRIRHDINTP